MPKKSIKDQILFKWVKNANKQQKRFLSFFVKMRQGKISQKEFEEKSKAFSIDVIEGLDKLHRKATIDVIIEAIEKLEKRVSKIESKMKL